MSNNRRKETRRVLLRMCWVDMGSGNPPLQCRLINVSKSGALIDCKEPSQLPDDLVLYLTEDGKVGRRCRVVRRAEGEIGLEFLNKPVPAPSWATAAEAAPPAAEPASLTVPI